MVVKKEIDKRFSIAQHLQYDAFEGGPIDETTVVLNLLESIGKSVNWFILELFARFGIKSNRELEQSIKQKVMDKCSVKQLHEHLLDTID